MKTISTYIMDVTGRGQNYFTLYREMAFIPDHGQCPIPPVVSFIQNLALDFDAACDKAREIAGPDVEGDAWSNHLLIYTDNGDNRAILRGDDVMRFGKYQGCRLKDIYEYDAKYITWLAGRGKINDKTRGWICLFDKTDPLVHHAIALCVGGGQWVERNGELMPVQKALFLNTLEGFKKPEITEKTRVKGLTVQIFGGINHHETGYGLKSTFKLVDENGFIYYASTTGAPGVRTKGGYLHSIFEFEPRSWFVVDFSAEPDQSKVYAKRIVIKDGPRPIQQ